MLGFLLLLWARTSVFYVLDASGSWAFSLECESAPFWLSGSQEFEKLAFLSLQGGWQSVGFFSFR